MRSVSRWPWSRIRTRPSRGWCQLMRSLSIWAPSTAQETAVLAVVEAAIPLGCPWALDPVGVGALPRRTRLACVLREAAPTAGQANCSEVVALLGGGAAARSRRRRPDREGVCSGCSFARRWCRGGRGNEGHGSRTDSVQGVGDGRGRSCASAGGGKRLPGLRRRRRGLRHWDRVRAGGLGDPGALRSGGGAGGGGHRGSGDLSSTFIGRAG
jgi:hypothetical protein